LPATAFLPRSMAGKLTLMLLYARAGLLAVLLVYGAILARKIHGAR
jgi:hypothetical protein